MIEVKTKLSNLSSLEEKAWGMVRAADHGLTFNELKLLFDEIEILIANPNISTDVLQELIKVSDYITTIQRNCWVGEKGQIENIVSEPGYGYGSIIGQTKGKYKYINPFDNLSYQTIFEQLLDNYNKEPRPIYPSPNHF